MPIMSDQSQSSVIDFFGLVARRCQNVNRKLPELISFALHSPLVLKKVVCQSTKLQLVLTVPDVMLKLSRGRARPRGEIVPHRHARRKKGAT
jgi:hypothetical protein